MSTLGADLARVGETRRHEVFSKSMKGRKVLVTGATGYIGGRLIPRLLEAGHQVRCVARHASRLEGRSWLKSVEVFEADLLKPETLPAVLEGMEAAYYLVHSMAGGADFQDRDVLAARDFGNAARAAGTGRIIYLGGLGNPDEALSAHLRSRQETGAVLRASGVPLTEFRCAVIVGSGSLSFEMIRYLAEGLPVMVCPRWINQRVQPISIRNVLEYLVEALETPESIGKTIEIGGADVLAYAEMIRGYGRVRGLRRRLLLVPVLMPRLSSYWIHLVTPVPVSIARPLIDGLRNEVVVRDSSARTIFPDIQPLDYDASVRLAAARLESGPVETVWSGSLASSHRDSIPVYLGSQEGMLLERRQQNVAAPPDRVFRAFARLGGERGWPAMNWSWQVRGFIDLLLGGVGMRRGRRDPEDLRVGDPVDFWRVEAIEEGRLVRFRAEMKLPGLAWLQFSVDPHGDGQSLLTQTAFFEPKGLPGLIYWYALYPFHARIFGGMIRNLSAEVETRQGLGDRTH